jgi:hypothetical protein
MASIIILSVFDPRLGYQVYDKAKEYMLNTVAYLDAYYIDTKDLELKKAIKAELQKLKSIYRQQAKNYHHLKQKLYFKLNDSHGSHKNYFSQEKEYTWQDYLVPQHSY